MKKQVKKITTKFLIKILILSMISSEAFSDEVQEDNGETSAAAITSTPNTTTTVSMSREGNQVEITSVRSGAEKASAKCNYPGVENERAADGSELSGGAFAGSIDLEVKNNRVTKLDAQIAGTNCRVTLGAFTQTNVGNNNIVLRNSDQCTVVIGFRSETVTRPDGSMVSNPVRGLSTAIMTFGLLSEQRTNGCAKLCPELESPKKFWQVDMNPRTDQCSH